MKKHYFVEGFYRDETTGESVSSSDIYRAESVKLASDAFINDMFCKHGTCSYAGVNRIIEAASISEPCWLCNEVKEIWDSGLCLDCYNWADREIINGNLAKEADEEQIKAHREMYLHEIGAAQELRDYGLAVDDMVAYEKRAKARFTEADMGDPAINPAARDEETLDEFQSIVDPYDEDEDWTEYEDRNGRL